MPELCHRIAVGVLTAGDRQSKGRGEDESQRRECHQQRSELNGHTLTMIALRVHVLRAAAPNMNVELTMIALRVHVLCVAAPNTNTELTMIALRVHVLRAAVPNTNTEWFHVHDGHKKARCV
jgi:hypothetical protein